ncbi:MAG TPA: GspH/FimT family pseudopilin [Candidatus Competibacteraceae bacterium]|nr:GspH/FimT family pseudopilin [Candidatus Competibacteraceae bacterium]
MPRAAGFSLFELLLVVALIALLGAVAMPMLGAGSGGAELRASARSLAAGLRAARTEALSRQRETVLSVDVERRRFQVGEGEVVQLPEDIGLKLHTARSELRGEGLGGIRFFPDGSATGGHIDVDGASAGFTVNVDWLTGAISIQAREVQP